MTTSTYSLSLNILILGGFLFSASALASEGHMIVKCVPGTLSAGIATNINVKQYCGISSQQIRDIAYSNNLLLGGTGPYSYCENQVKGNVLSTCYLGGAAGPYYICQNGSWQNVGNSEGYNCLPKQ